MKKNLFISVALIVLAVLAGCTPQSNFPAYPVTATITQTGDFMKGQALDSSKFQVVVTYLDGSTKTLENVALSSTDYSATTGVQGGEDVSVTVGTDINGKAVIAKGSIANVYEVAYITATTSKTEFAAGDADPADFTVTAYYGNNQEVLSTAYYTVNVAAGKATVTLVSSLGSETVEVPVTVKQPTYTGDVTAITGFHNENTTFVLGALDYTETGLPAVEDIASQVSLTVTTDNPAVTSLYANQIEGLELSYVKADGTAINTMFDSLDFTAKASSAAENSGIKLVASYNGVEKEYEIQVAPTSVTVVYKGTPIVAGTPTADYEFDMDKLRVTLKVGDVVTDVTSEIEEIDLSFVDGNTPANPLATAAGAGDKNFITVDYYGCKTVTKGELVSTNAPATIESVTFAVADTYKAPAKQYYNAVPAIAASDIEDFEVTMSDGSESKLTAADFTWALYTAADEETKIALEDGELNLSSETALYVGATYGDKTYFSGASASEVSVTLGTAVATKLEAKVEASDMVDGQVDVTINTLNDNGYVEKGVTTGLAYLDSDGATMTTAPTFGEAGTVKVTAAAQTYTVYLTADVTKTATISIPAGKGYVAPKTAIDVAQKAEGTVQAGVGTAITADLIKSLYVVDEDTYEIKEGTNTVAAPEITGVKVPAGQTIKEGTNTIDVVISYVGSDGKTATATADVSITGVAYVNNANPAFKLTYTDGDNTTALTSFTHNGSYVTANIGVDPASVAEYVKGDVDYTISVTRGDNNEDKGASFTANQYEGGFYNVVINFIGPDLKEATSTVRVNVTAAQN